MRPNRKFISISVCVEPLIVVSIAEATVFIVDGIFTFPLVLRVVCVCMVPDVLNVEIEPVG